MYPESTTDSPARLSLRQTGSPGMIYSARYGSPKRQLQFYRSRERGGGEMFAGGYAGGPRGPPGRRKSSHCVPENLQIPKPAGPGGGLPRSVSSGSSGKMLSMSYSESIRSGINRYHSDQGLNLPRPADQAALQRLREQRVAAQIKNMEDFLKMNGLALEECVSYQTGMKY
ncbi:unnamed protein product, partial [Gadus morhua 'NCC']